MSEFGKTIFRAVVVQTAASVVAAVVVYNLNKFLKPRTIEVTPEVRAQIKESVCKTKCKACV